MHGQEDGRYERSGQGSERNGQAEGTGQGSDGNGGQGQQGQGRQDVGGTRTGRTSVGTEGKRQPAFGGARSKSHAFVLPRPPITCAFRSPRSGIAETKARPLSHRACRPFHFARTHKLAIHGGYNDQFGPHTTCVRAPSIRWLEDATSDGDGQVVAACALNAVACVHLQRPRGRLRGCSLLTPLGRDGVEAARPGS